MGAITRPVRRHFIAFALFMCYLVGASTLQVFGVYMTSLSEEFNVSTAVLGVTCGLGFSLQFLLGPFASVVVNKISFRWAVMAGGTLEAVGITLCYFARSTTELIIYLGILPGIGASLIYVSGPGLMACYFTKNYSTVMGIVLSGAGAGIFMIPPLVEELISVYGWRGALLIHGALTFNTVSAGAIFQTVVSNLNQKQDNFQNGNEDFNGYESKQYETLNISHSPKGDCYTVDPSKQTQSSSKNTRWYYSYLRIFIYTPHIILVYVAAFLVNSAYSAVVIHVFNQIVQSGYSERQGALALSLLGVGSLLGRLFHGVLIDATIIAPSTLYLVSLLIASGASFLNPIVNTYVVSVLCASCIGVTSGIQFPLIFTILRRMTGTSQLVTATGLGMFTDGCGLLAGGYLAGVIQDMTGNYSLAHYINASTYLLGACFFFPIVLIERKHGLGIASLKETTKV